MRYFLLVLLSCTGFSARPPASATRLTPEDPDYARARIDIVKTKANKQPGADSLPSFDFRKYADGKRDAYPALQAACDYCIAHPETCTSLKLPVGTFRISHPLILQKVENGRWAFFNFSLSGATPAKSAVSSYQTTIICDFRSGFGIGIQFGRGISIQNLNIIGKYTFPDHISNSNIATTLYAQWNDNSVEDGRYNPYAGICIDPFCDPAMLKPELGYSGMRSYYLPNTGRGGTSGVEIVQCAIHHFSVGIMLTPNGYTQNDEMINIIDDNIDGVKVAIAIGQDQSKEIHIDRLKVWASTYTILDGLLYGRGTGGGSVMINGMNIAGNVNQLFNLSAGRFPLSARDVYAESLFRIGWVDGWAGCNLDHFQIDLLTGPGLPAADYVFAGTNINWTGGMLRYYDNDFSHRINISGHARLSFRDMTFNNLPITQGLYGIPVNSYPKPAMQNVNLFYNQSRQDTLIELVRFFPEFKLNKSNWTNSFDAGSQAGRFKVGDYILSEGYPGYKYYDTEMEKQNCPTVQQGRVVSITGTRVNLDDVGLNAYSGPSKGRVFICRLK